MGHRTSGAALVAVATLALGHAAVQSNAAPAAGMAGAAVARLTADASGRLTLLPDGRGGYSFLGVPAGESVDAPDVSATTGVRAAAAAHLARYGAAFGTGRSGTTISELGASRTVTGNVVRYQQLVGGLPVLAGELAVSLRPDRGLDSILAETTSLTKVPAAHVSEATAAEAAQGYFQRAAGLGADGTVTSLGRWVVDPTLIGASTDLPIRTAWRFEVTRAAHERRLLLVDDQTGLVLMNNDLIDEVENRIVCDNANVGQNPNVSDAPCVSASANLVRTEAGPAAALAEANKAYDLGGVVWDNYQAFGGVDLTSLIGRVVDGGSTKALSQTVRWCYTGSTCPYANAFWNGNQMYYGQGYAVADDVVGHEMTHGVTERTSNLVYWGQSGAMNESLSDIMGEIIDHRNVTGADVPATAWALGEDLPGFPTGLRNVQDPTLKNDPDKMSSPLYVKEVCNACYPDGDGVHTNSGVGNHTFYLASQGGTFNGQTITGIDTGDATLTRSAKLWLLVDQSLTSGSDYADEATVLEQSCAALQGTGVMTAANCTAVHQATLATELRNTPTNNPQPADATMSCDTGGTLRVMLDGESGSPTTKFTGGPGWGRDGTPGAGQVAHSGPDAWSNDEASTAMSTSLVANAGIALPARQPSYLFFQQWRVLDYDAGGFYDAGTVEVNGADTGAMTWVNGPTDIIASGFGNPKAGRRGFGGDSRGYLASRLDLSPFAGQSVTPQFTMSTDSSFSGLGWFLDDVVVYTCDGGAIPVPATPTPTPNPTTGPTTAPTGVPVSPAAAGVAVRGGLGKAVVSWQTPTSGAAAVSAYRVFTTGISTSLPASARSTTLTGLKQGTTYPVTVVPIVAAGQPGTPVTVNLVGTQTRLVVRQAGAKTKLSGKLTGSSGVVGATLKMYVKKGTKWVKVATTKTGKGGAYAVKVAGTKKRTFRAVYAGGPGLLGNRSPGRHR